MKRDAAQLVGSRLAMDSGSESGSAPVSDPELPTLDSSIVQPLLQRDQLLLPNLSFQSSYETSQLGKNSGSSLVP